MTEFIELARESQRLDAMRRAIERAADLDRRIRRLTLSANRFRRLVELLTVAERAGLHMKDLRAMLGGQRLVRAMREGARGDDLALVRGAVRERQRIARIAARFPNYAGGAAYPLAENGGR